jgi:hypothetical protein
MYSSAVPFGFQRCPLTPAPLPEGEGRQAVIFGFRVVPALAGEGKDRLKPGLQAPDFEFRISDLSS